MKRGLLVVERMVLESLAAKNGIDVEAIMKQTHLKSGLVLNILQNFHMKNYVTYKNGKYSLNMETKESWLIEFNESENVKEEVKDLFTGLVNEFFSKERNNIKTDVGLKLKKMYMTDTEEQTLGSLFLNLEIFFQDLMKKQNERKKEQKLFQKKVVIWGHSPYGNIVEQGLKAV